MTVKKSTNPVFHYVMAHFIYFANLLTGVIEYILEINLHLHLDVQLQTYNVLQQRGLSSCRSLFIVIWANTGLPNFFFLHYPLLLFQF